MMKQFALSIGATAAALALLATTPGFDGGAVLQAQDSLAKTAPSAPTMQTPELPADFKPLFDGITLSEAQNRQIAGIAQKYAGSAGQPDSSNAGMGAGARDRRMDVAQELRTVLTADQQRVFDKNLGKVKATWGKKIY